MKKNNDYSVISVITGLTRGEASKVSASIFSAKERYAPDARGTSAMGRTSDVGKMLSTNNQKFLGGKKNG